MLVDNVVGNEYNWIKSFLTERRQFVTVNNCISDCVNTRSGVPQGSILGPLIFCMFMNDICYLKLHAHSKMSLYADDTAIFNYGKTMNDVHMVLQEDFDLICKWLDLNNMHLHPQKTKVMAFGHRRKLVNNILVLKFKGQPIENVHEIKYLGVIFYSGMTWKEHICYIVGKISRAIAY